MAPNFLKVFLKARILVSKNYIAFLLCPFQSPLIPTPAPFPDIDECTIDPDICGNHAECKNTHGGYRCDARACPSGYHSKWDGNCVDINECVLGIANCSVGTECSNIEGGIFKFLKFVS